MKKLKELVTSQYLFGYVIQLNYVENGDVYNTVNTGVISLIFNIFMITITYQQFSIMLNY